jgi:ribonuclease HII
MTSEYRIRITDRDLERFEKMAEWERELRSQGFRFIAGVDEAGRGPLAGPVVAAACILPPDVNLYGLNDSKKMTEKRREALYSEIKENAVAWCVTMVSEKDIDLTNILDATKDAMRQALRGLRPQPDVALIDAVVLEGFDYPILPRVQGDAHSNVIAAASVLAKVTRDNMMRNFDKVYPAYGFAQHKGYGTKAHIEAIMREGPCPIHRLSFLKNIVQPSHTGSSTNKTGENVERHVAYDLISRGFTIIDRRYSLPNIGEIDLIAKHGQRIMIIECKGRGPTSHVFGGSEEALEDHQIQRIKKASSCWLDSHPLGDDMTIELYLAAVDLDEKGHVSSLTYLPIDSI